MLDYKNARLAIWIFFEWVSDVFDQKILTTEAQLYEVNIKIWKLDRKWLAGAQSEICFLNPIDKLKFDRWMRKISDAIELLRATECELCRTLDYYSSIKEVQNIAKKVYENLEIEHGKSIQYDIEL